MEMMLLNFSLALTEMISMYILYTSLMGKRFDGIKHKVVLAAVAVVNAFAVTCCEGLPLSLKAAVCIGTMLVGSTILSKEKLYIKFAFVTTALYILYIVDIIMGNLFSLLFDSEFLDVFYSSFSNRLVVCYIIKVLDILVFFYLYSEFKKINLHMRRREWLLYDIIASVMLIITVVYIFLYSSANSDRNTTMLFFFLSMGFFVMSMIVIYFLAEVCSGFQEEKKLYLLESNISALEEQLVIRNQTAEKLRKIRHDIKNHLRNVSVLLENDCREEAAALIRQLDDEAEEIGIELSQSTGSGIIDAVISCKAAVCENKGIRFTYHLEPLPKINISAADISSVLSNLLDNAIEAAYGSDKKAVDIKIFIYKDYLSIVTVNSYCHIVNGGDGKLVTTKTDKELHGWGMNIISDTAEKYNGNYTWNAENDSFKSVVLMMTCTDT
ncbi:MAG: sensor histidine kinase [Huintestinicola sp.]